MRFIIDRKHFLFCTLAKIDNAILSPTHILHIPVISYDFIAKGERFYNAPTLDGCI